MNWPPSGIDWYYSDDYTAIAHGDCREILPGLEKVDLLLTDPPYGIGEAAGKNKSREGLAIPTDFGNDDWDDERIDGSLMAGIVWNCATYAIVWGGNYYAECFPPSAGWLVWDKDNGTTDFADCELAWTDLPQAVRMIKYRWNGMLQEPGQERNIRQHPTQKPIQLMKWCIAQADKHRDIQTILDPFMGSGTTLRAAKDLQRKCIGIEIEEKYCEIAAKRLAQEVLAL